MGGRRNQLLEQAEILIKTYNHKRTTLESHAAEFLGARVDADSSFLREVFYGVMRCKPALTVFMACFFNDMSARVLRSDYTMYMILTYLSVFRLKELTLPGFRKFALSIDPDKMINFLEYVFDASTLESSGVIAHWTRTFDPDYVRGTLVNGLTNARPEIEGLLSELHEKSMGLAAAKQEPVEQRESRGLGSVKPKAPNLTVAAARVVPNPKTIKQATVGKDSGAIWCQSDARQGVQDESVVQYSPKEPALPPVLTDTRCTRPQAQQALEERSAKKLLFATCQGTGRLESSNATVKLNVASILREAALFHKKQALDVALLDEYEAELRDGKEFHQWQAKMRSRDQTLRLGQIARTRTLAKASSKEARLAKLEKLIDNQQLAAHSVEESLAMRKQRSLEANMSWKRKRCVVEEIRQKQGITSRRALEAIFIEKCHIRDEIRQNIKKRSEQRQFAQAARARALADYVKKSKAEHGVHRDHLNVFDPTGMVGLGLLDEMSFVEMRQRFVRNKKRHKEQLEQKRLGLITEKHIRQCRLSECAKSTKKIREVATKKNLDDTFRQQQGVFTTIKANQEVKSNLLLRQVVDVSHNRNRLKKEGTSQDRLMTGANKQFLETKTKLELLRGAERVANRKQNSVLDFTAQHEINRLRGQHQKTIIYDNTEARKRMSLALAEKTVSEAALENMRMQKLEIGDKKQRYLTQNKTHKRIMETMINPYTEKVNTLSVIRARRHAIHKCEATNGL